MAVFSTLLSDGEILSLVQKVDASTIMLVACGGCTNESLAFTRQVPIYVCSKGETLEVSMANNRAIPYATQSTAEQIELMLRREGYAVRTCVVPLGEELLCIQSRDSNISFSDVSKIDLVLALCCPAGVVGINRKIKNIPILPLMKPQGQLFYVYRDGQYAREIDYSESIVIE